MKHAIFFYIFFIAFPIFSQIEKSAVVKDSSIKITIIEDHMDSLYADSYDIRVMEYPNRKYRAGIFANSLINEKNKEKAAYYYYMLKRDYGDITWIKDLLIDQNPDALVSVGKLVPPFEVTLLDGSGKVSNKSMLGKYYVIDFWATYCGPCIAEIPNLNKAYEKYCGVKGFEILSISMDQTESKIKSFLAAKWEKERQMPWMNAFTPGGIESNLAKEFEVAGLPKPILVGPDGRILAKREDLHGDQLKETLERYLGGNEDGE